MAFDQGTGMIDPNRIPQLTSPAVGDVAPIEVMGVVTEGPVDAQSPEVMVSIADLAPQTELMRMTTRTTTTLLPPRANEPDLAAGQEDLDLPVLVASRKDLGLPTPTAGWRDPLIPVARRGNRPAPASRLNPNNQSCLPRQTPRIVLPDLSRV